MTDHPMRSLVESQCLHNIGLTEHHEICGRTDLKTETRDVHCPRGGHGDHIVEHLDFISDAYYPFGRNKMLEVAFLAAHLLWMTARAEIEMLYDMVTVAPARAMN